MDINIINDLIADLEQAEETSLSNARNLSALYIVRNQMTNKDMIQSDVTKELHDILPSYKRYIDMKRRYQMQETTKESVLSYMKQLCIEIKEFIRTLYSSTDMPEERTMIQQMLKEIP